MADYKEIAIIGDSIANGFFDEAGAGWYGRLLQKANERTPASLFGNNYAVSGDRIFDAYHRLCSDVILRRPDILLIAIGVNDVIRWNTASDEMDISWEMRDEFWRLLLDTARKNVEKICVLGILPVNEEKMPETGIFDKKLYYLNKDIEAYNKFIANICADYSLPFFDLYPVFARINAANFLYDGVHPNGDGHEAIADFLLGELDKLDAL